MDEDFYYLPFFSKMNLAKLVGVGRQSHLESSSAFTDTFLQKNAAVTLGFVFFVCFYQLHLHFT